MWNRLPRLVPVAPCALVATACLSIAGCGGDAYESTATAELQEQLGVLRRATDDSERNLPAGLKGVPEVRRVGPRNVKDASLWVYINEKGDRVCPWLETGSENSLQTSCLTAEQLENASTSSSAQGGSTMTTSYGVVPDEAKCMLLKLKNGDVAKAPVTQNGWLVGTTSKNPVMDAKSTTASCS